MVCVSMGPRSVGINVVSDACKDGAFEERKSYEDECFLYVLFELNFYFLYKIEENADDSVQNSQVAISNANY